MATSAQRTRLADLLQDVVEGRVAPQAALKTAEAWTDMPWKERELSAAWHVLAHFQIDEDIRQKDHNYDEGIRQQLNRQIGKLRRMDS